MSGSPLETSPGSDEPGDVVGGPGAPPAGARQFAGGEHPARRDEQVSAETVGGDYALHDGRTGRVHFLNRSAAAVWDLLDGSLSVDALVAELALRFDAPEAEVRAGVQQVLELFHTEGLLRRG